MDRFKGLPWFPYAKDTSIAIIGAGGIGSWTSFLLARAGFNLTVFDDDYVDNTNLSGQLFPKSLEGARKTSALQEVIVEFNNSLINVITSKVERYPSKLQTMNIVINAVDNMATRQFVFNHLEEDIIKGKRLLIDGRLLAEQFEIFCLQNEEDCKVYETNHLYPDSDVPEVECTAKQTSHYAAMIAANITRFVTNYILNKHKGIPAYVPFKYNIEGLLPDHSFELNNVSDEFIY